MILSDREIQAALRDRVILIDPPPAETLFSSMALGPHARRCAAPLEGPRRSPLRPSDQALPVPDGLQYPGDDGRPELFGQGRDRPDRRLRAGSAPIRPGLYPAAELSAEPVEDRRPGRGEEQPGPARRRGPCDGPDDPCRIRVQPGRRRPSRPADPARDLQRRQPDRGPRHRHADLPAHPGGSAEVPTRGYQGRFSAQGTFTIGPSS